MTMMSRAIKARELKEVKKKRKRKAKAKEALKVHKKKRAQL